MTAVETTVRINGLDLCVRERGEGGAALLLNGIGAHIGMWATLEAAVPDRATIAFDAPGTGRSRRSPRPLSMSALARLAIGLLDRLERGRVDVLGYSFGGVIAQHLAHIAPERVNRLVLVATTPGLGGTVGSPVAVLNVVTPLRYFSRRFYERTVGSLAGGRARTDREWVRQHGQERLQTRPDPLGYAWQVAAAMTTVGTLPWVHTLRQPTLIVAGDDDPLMPLANAMVLAERIPHARLFVAPGEGHLMLLDPESAALPVIREFLTADELDSSLAWRRCIEVDRDQVAAALPRGLGRWRDPSWPTSALARAVWKGSDVRRS